jgi:hypothetical protein
MPTAKTHDAFTRATPGLAKPQREYAATVGKKNGRLCGTNPTVSFRALVDMPRGSMIDYVAGNAAARIDFPGA